MAQQLRTGTRPGPAASRRKPLGLWALWSLAPFGWLTWVGFLVAAERARHKRRWRLYGLLFLLLAAVPVVVEEAVVNPGEGEPSDWYGAAIIFTWVAGVGASFVLRLRWQAEASGRYEELESPEERARRRMRVREEAQRLARSEPELALELGLGRPDVRGADHRGVVDVNHAPAAAIASIPNVGPDLAERIVSVREELGGRGFSSCNELAATLDLPPEVVDDLERHTIYLPRR